MPKVPPWVVQVMAQQNFCQAGDLCGERRGICYLDITVQNPIQRLIYGSTQSGNKCTDPTPLRGKNSSLVGCALEIVDKCRNAWKGENVLSLWDPAAAVESGSQDELHRSANSDPEFRSESHWRGRAAGQCRTCHGVGADPPRGHGVPGCTRTMTCPNSAGGNAAHPRRCLCQLSLRGKRTFMACCARSEIDMTGNMPKPCSLSMLMPVDA